MAWQPHQRVQPEAYCYLGHRNVVAKHQPATYQGAKRALSCLREREKGKREKLRGEGRGREGRAADIEGRLGTQGDFCSLKQLLEETSLLFCFLLTPFLLFVLAKDMYKNVFWYVFSLGLYQNISFVSVHGTFGFFMSCLCKLVLPSDHVRDQRRHNLWTYWSQHLMLARHVYFFTR